MVLFISIIMLNFLDMFVHRPQHVLSSGSGKRLHHEVDLEHISRSNWQPEPRSEGIDNGGIPTLQYSTWNCNQAYGDSEGTSPFSGSYQRNPDSMMVTLDGAVLISLPTLNTRFPEAVVRAQQCGLETIHRLQLQRAF